jgi:hypothetical protein
LTSFQRDFSTDLQAFLASALITFLAFLGLGFGVGGPAIWIAATGGFPCGNAFVVKTLSRKTIPTPTSKLMTVNRHLGELSESTLPLPSLGFCYCSTGEQQQEDSAHVPIMVRELHNI